MPTQRTKLSIGTRFERLVVTGETVVTKGKYPSTMYTCMCDCGTEIRAYGYDLKAEKTKSCGCLNKERLSKGRGADVDLVGQKFGRLLVLSPAGLKFSGTEGHKRQTWTCKCDCGTNKVLTTSELNSGRTVSCGCYLAEVIRTANSYSQVNYFRRLALKDGKEWKLTEAEAIALLSGDCAYCGAVPTTDKRHKYLKRNGIDRVDSSLGYIPSNVVSCCKQCNIAKNNYSLADFKNWALRLAANLTKTQ